MTRCAAGAPPAGSLGDDTPRAVGFGALLLEWRETAASLNAALTAIASRRRRSDEAELAAIAANDLADAPAAVRADCPDWCAPLIEESFGDDWVEECAGLAARPPLDLRVNTLLSNRERVIAELEGTGVAPTVLATARHPHPADRRRWPPSERAGRARLPERLVRGAGRGLAGCGGTMPGRKPGMQVLDFCAGAGGKTLALSAIMQNRGQIFAHDSDKSRLAPIFDRIRRSENRNVQVVSKPAELEPLVGARWTSS